VNYCLKIFHFHLLHSR